MWLWAIVAVVAVIGILKLAQRRRIHERYEELQEATLLKFNLLNEAKKNLPIAIAQVGLVCEKYPESVIKSYKSGIWVDLYQGTEDEPEDELLPKLKTWPESLSELESELERLTKEGRALSATPLKEFSKDHPREIWDRWHQWNQAIHRVHCQISWGYFLPAEIRAAEIQALLDWQKIQQLVAEITNLLEQKKDVFVPEFTRLCAQRLQKYQQRDEWLATVGSNERRDWIGTSKRAQSSIFVLEMLKKSLTNWKKVTKEDLAHMVRMGIV